MIKTNNDRAWRLILELVERNRPLVGQKENLEGTSRVAKKGLTMRQNIAKVTSSRKSREKHPGGGRGSCDLGFWNADCGMKNRR